MKLNVAIQMDHVSTIDIDGDSTFVLGLEAERRGYDVWHYTPSDLIFRDRKVLALDEASLLKESQKVTERVWQRMMAKNPDIPPPPGGLQWLDA